MSHFTETGKECVYRDGHRGDHISHKMLLVSMIAAGFLIGGLLTSSILLTESLLKLFGLPICGNLNL